MIVQFSLSLKAEQVNGARVVYFHVFASLWLQDITDDEEQEIRIPVVIAKKAAQIRQNYLNDVALKTHDCQRVGWLTCRVMLDSGLDADHEKTANKWQATRHTFGK